MPGLWENWQAPDGGEMETCTLLTTEASPTLAAIHHRMPVILPPDAYARWLDPANERPDTLSDLLGPYTVEPMALDAVSTFVNNARHEGRDCLTPAE